MASQKYTYSADTLQYLSIKESFVHRFRRKLSWFTAFAIAGVSAYFLTAHFHFTFEEKLLHAENNSLKNQFTVLSAEIAQLNDIIKRIEHEDDHLFRAIYGIAPLDSSIRIAGFGGVPDLKYEKAACDEVVNKTSRDIAKLSSRLKLEERSLIMLKKRAEENMEQMMHLPAIMPVHNEKLQYTGSGFGMRFHPILKINRMHEGIDFIARKGAEVYATAKGVVSSVRVSRTFGNIVEIDHGYGYKTLYAHLNAFNVKSGQQVNRGDLIAWVGNTGLSAGTHLHYEVHYMGKEVDPVHYFFNDLTAAEYEKIIMLAKQNTTSLD